MSRTVTDPNNWRFGSLTQHTTLRRRSFPHLEAPLGLRLRALSSAFMPSKLRAIVQVAATLAALNRKLGQIVLDADDFAIWPSFDAPAK